MQARCSSKKYVNCAVHLYVIDVFLFQGMILVGAVQLDKSYHLTVPPQWY